MIVLVGESGSGKSTIATTLSRMYGYENVVTYTTRDKRKTERDGIDYHFVSEEKFNEIKEFLCLVAQYRGWSYGANIQDFGDNKVIVVTPSGLRELKRLGVNITSFYIKISRRDRLIKLLQRGDDIEEAYRRSLSDIGQFDGIEDEVDFVIDNDHYSSVPDMIAQIIKEDLDEKEYIEKGE